MNSSPARIVTGGVLLLLAFLTGSGFATAAEDISEQGNMSFTFHAPAENTSYGINGTLTGPVVEGSGFMMIFTEAGESNSTNNTPVSPSGRKVTIRKNSELDADLIKQALWSNGDPSEEPNICRFCIAQKKDEDA